MLTLPDDTAMIRVRLIHPGEGIAMFDRLISHLRNKSGQSFVELMLILLVLALILAGVVEFGFLMNNYLHVLDGAREAARFSANSVAIDADGNSIPSFYQNTATQAENVMRPVVLDSARGDDIIVSVFSVAGENILRFPDALGWSRFGNHISSFTTAEILALMDPLAPPSGLLVVEIFYNYPQVLELPLFADFLNPIPVYTYSVMPLSSAEPTPTPRP
jgi:hypothetical protein